MSYPFDNQPILNDRKMVEFSPHEILPFGASFYIFAYINNKNTTMKKTNSTWRKIVSERFAFVGALVLCFMLLVPDGMLAASAGDGDRDDITLTRKKNQDKTGTPRRLPAPVSACYDDTYLYISTLAATVGYAVTAADAMVAASGTAVTADGEARIPLAGFEPGVYTLTLAADGVVYEGTFVVDGGMK